MWRSDVYYIVWCLANSNVNEEYFCHRNNVYMNKERFQHSLTGQNQLFKFTFTIVKILGRTSECAF